jgi:hypothetical protein
MPLTPEERIRLNELNQRFEATSGSIAAPVGQQQQVATPAASSGLTQEEETRLSELDTRFQVNVDRDINQAFNILQKPTPTVEFIPGAAGIEVPGKEIGPRLRQQEIAKRQARQDLLDRGFTPEQIDMTLDIEKGLPRVPVGRTVGGTIGSIAGPLAITALTPGPIDDAGLMIALIAAGSAGVGGIAGEQAQTAIEDNRALTAREVFSAFSNEALTELGGRGLTRLGKFVVSPLTKKAIPEAAELIEDFTKVGGQFSATELDDRWALRGMESFARSGFGTKRLFQDFEKRQASHALAFADIFIDSLGEGVARLPKEELGTIFAEGITRPGGRVFQLFDDLFDPAFKQVDDLALENAQKRFIQTKAGGTVRGTGGKFQAAREAKAIKITPTVSTDSLKKFANKEIALDSRIKHLSPTGRTKLKETLELPDKLTFSEMRQKRSAFIKDARKLGRDVDQSEKIIVDLVNITDDAIFAPSSKQGLSGEALNLLENLNKVYAASKEGLKTTFSESLAKRLIKNPSNVVKELFPSNNPKQIRLLRESLIEPISGIKSKEGEVLWNQLRQVWFKQVVDDATKEGVINPKTMQNVFRKMGGDDVLKEIFPNDLAGAKKVQALFEIAGKKPPTSIGLFVHGSQALGLKKMYDSGKEGDFIGVTAGAALAVGPLVFAKLMTNPQGIKLLTKSLNIKPGSKAVTSNAIRMIRLLRDINKRESKQQLNFERQKKARVRGAQEKARRRGLARPSL